MTESESLKATEKLGSAGATHPRITLDYIKGQIRSVAYGPASIGMHREHASPHLDAMTLCKMELQSGFVVIGKSAPLSPENFDRAKGEVFAYEDCIRQLWPMFAFHQLQAKYEAD